MVSSFILICRGEIRPPGVDGGGCLLSSSESIPNPPLVGIFDPGRNGLNPTNSLESLLASSFEKRGEFSSAVDKVDLMIWVLRWGGAKYPATI